MRCERSLCFINFALISFPPLNLISRLSGIAVYGLWPLLVVHFLSCRGNLSGTSETFFSVGPWNESVTFPPSVITVGAAEGIRSSGLWIQGLKNDSVAAI